MNNKKFVVVGATGRVGREMLKVLHEFGVPAENVSAAASEKSAGMYLQYDDKSEIKVQNLEEVNFSKYDIGLFSAGGAISERFAPIAASRGCIVIDNTSYFRMHDDIPLIVPEINFADLKKYNSGIISNPNCSTIQMVMALKPLHDAFGLKEVVASTYQATSGAGQKGFDELLLQTKQIMDGQPVEPHHFKRQIAFNLIPQIDVFTDSLYTKEEIKMMNETKKILELHNIDITATCVRVPVFVGHAVSVFAKFEKPVDLREATDALRKFDGVKVMDNPEMYEFATPIDAASKNDVFVSRIRKHPTIDKALSFWCVADNVRKGAALNAVQIAKKLCE